VDAFEVILDRRIFHACQQVKSARALGHHAAVITSMELVDQLLDQRLQHRRPMPG